ncbi:hypothetical protein SETIT_5G297900v2 [Setaria italica]|uniref:Uncharacterized protein n=1 Tax=Setaria italica TaxID=4555 RepID=A0A368RBY2_SETIT|nr:hypothetical protein SETIT_5G297900v2 [Setaria italica]
MRRLELGSWQREEGMVPEKALELRSSTSSSGSAAKESGMVPLKWLKERASTLSCCSPVKASAGSSLEKLLFDRLRAASEVRPATSGGNAPTRWLPERLSVLRPRQSERVPPATSPVMRLPERSRYSSPEQLVNSGSPEILFPERSRRRTAPTPAPTIHRRSPSPEILLSERSRASSPNPEPPPPPDLGPPTESPERLSAFRPPQDAASASTSATEPRRPAFPDRSSDWSLAPHLGAAASAPLTLAPRRLSVSRLPSCSSVAATARKSALSGTPASDSDVSLPPLQAAPGNLQAPSAALHPRTPAAGLCASDLNCSSSWASSAAATTATTRRASTASSPGDSMN